MVASCITDLVSKHQHHHLKRSTVGVVTLFKNHEHECKVYLHYCHKGVGKAPFEIIDSSFKNIPSINVKCVIDATNPANFYLQNNTDKCDGTAEHYVFQALNINYYYCIDTNNPSVFWDVQ